jgi:hypothetical protein
MARAAPANIITNHVSLLLREGPVYPEKISNLGNGKPIPITHTLVKTDKPETDKPETDKPSVPPLK